MKRWLKAACLAGALGCLLAGDIAEARCRGANGWCTRADRQRAREREAAAAIEAAAYEKRYAAMSPLEKAQEDARVLRAELQSYQGALLTVRAEAKEAKDRQAKELEMRTAEVATLHTWRTALLFGLAITMLLGFVAGAGWRDEREKRAPR